MKSILTFFVVAFIAVVIYRCSPSATTEPEIKTVAEAKAWVEPPTIVPYGGNATLFWESTNVTSVTINGTQVPNPNKGSEELKSLTSNISHILVFKGIDGQLITKTVDIIVEAKPIPTRTDTLCAKPLYPTEEKVLVDGKWTYTNLYEIEKNSPLYFYPNGKYERIKPDGTLMANGTWSWSGPNTINMDGGIFKYSLTATEFMRFQRDDTIIEIYTRK